MAEITLISKDSKTNTSTRTNIIDVLAGATEVDLFIDRTDMQDETVAVGVQLFLSLDGGISWMPWGGFGTRGGDIENEEKKIEAKSGMVSNLPYPEKKNRKIMAVKTVVGTVNTALKCEMK